MPEWLLYLQDGRMASGVSDRAVRLYAVLWSYADRETQRAWPSRKTLARAVGCSVRTLDRVTDELVEFGAIVKYPRLDNAGDSTSNEYLVRTSHAGYQATLGLPPVTRGSDTDDATPVQPVSPGSDSPVAQSRTTHQEPLNHSENGAAAATLVHADVLVSKLAAAKGMPLTRSVRRRWIPQFVELLEVGLDLDDEELDKFFQFAADAGLRMPSGIPYFLAEYKKLRRDVEVYDPDLVARAAQIRKDHGLQ